MREQRWKEMYYIRAEKFEGNISKYRKQMAGG
jgi:hypothetical protein